MIHTIHSTRLDRRATPYHASTTEKPSRPTFSKHLRRDATTRPKKTTSFGQSVAMGSAAGL